MKNLTKILLIIIVLNGCKPQGNDTSNISEEQTIAEPTKNELIGVWWWDEWKVDNEDTTFHATDLYGQVIYTESHYSTIFIQNDGPRENLLADNSWDTHTVEDLRNTIGLVTANSGRYTIEGDSIVHTRDVALYPGAMTDENRTHKWAYPTFSGNYAIWEGDGWMVRWVRKE